MYTLSHYNKYIEYEGGLVVFNAISGKIIRVTDEKVKRYFSNNGLIDQDFGKLDELIHDGYIVYENTDEEARINFKINEMIYDRTLELIIVPTTDCNFRCEYCYQDFPNKKMTKTVQESIVLFVKKNIRFFTGVRVNWYGGEPLLGRDAILRISRELIDICQRAGKPYISTITTNGYLLSEKTFTEMLNCKIVSFVVTIDGTATLHNKYRHLKDGTGTFDRILANLRTIRDLRPQKMFSILIRVNVTKESLNSDLGNLIRHLEEEFGSDNRFEFLFYPVTDWGGPSVGKMKKELFDSYDEIFEFLISTKIKLNLGPFYKYLQLGSCWAAKRYSYLVDPEGHIKKCTLLVDRDEHNIGILSDDGKMCINEDILAKWILPTRQKTDLCTVCSHKTKCVSFCPFIKNFSASGFDCEFKFFNVDNILNLLLRCDKSLHIKTY